MAKDSGCPGRSIQPIPEGALTGPPRRRAEFHAATLSPCPSALATPRSDGYCPPLAQSRFAARDPFVPKPPGGPPWKLGEAPLCPARLNVLRSDALRDHRCGGRHSQSDAPPARPPSDRSRLAQPAPSPDE